VARRSLSHLPFRSSSETQQEIDYFWEKLSAGGETQRCGWLKDKFGVSWQIVPPILGELLNDEDDEKSNRVMQVMMKMSKLDIKGLKKAYEGK
jgi:predicted 3-demethylubiquinone-9 3-methyltransferase (glyoxalase superfamily)